jgi:predicted aspartyl protease
VDSFGNERDQQLLSRTLDLTPDPKDVDITPTRHALVEFPATMPLVHLPVRFVNGLAVVRVRIGVHAYDFLLDSGAAGIVVDPSVIDDQKLDTYGTRIGATVGTFNETTAIVPSIAIGPIRMRGVVTRVVTVPFHLDDRTRIAGLLGFDFFADCVVHVDLEHGIADAMLPGTFRPPSDAAAVPLALDDRTPAVRARADGTPGRMVIDTGANRSILTTAFAARAEIAGDGSGGVMRFRGVGGVGVGEAVDVKTFDVGGVGVNDAVVDVSGADLGTEDVDATIGTDIAQAFDLYFDYRSATLYVRRAHRSISAIIPGS